MTNERIGQILKFRSEMEARLFAVKAPVPRKQIWEDEVMYNNSLLEAVEIAELKAGVRT